MTEREFDIIDALYFTVSFERLRSDLGADEVVLKKELLDLFEKGWVKCLEKISEIEVEEKELVAENYKAYNFLASKIGLTLHNSR